MEEDFTATEIFLKTQVATFNQQGLKIQYAILDMIGE